MCALLWFVAQADSYRHAAIAINAPYDVNFYDFV